MKCHPIIKDSLNFLLLLAVPNAAINQALKAKLAGKKPLQKSMKQIVPLHKAFLVSVVLTIISGLAIIPTAAKTTANYVFKAGCASFGTLAAVIAICVAVKVRQALKDNPRY